MSSFIKDIRFSFRMLLKRPGLTLVAALTLALGIGATTAIFSGVNAFVLRPMPVPEQERMVRLSEAVGSNTSDSFSYLNYKDYNEKNDVFEGIVAMDMAQAALSQENQNDVIWGETVSGNYFEVMKIKPALGRAFSHEEGNIPDTHAVVVISDSLWQRRFNSDKNIVGKNVTLNGRSFTVIGVAPKEFTGSKFALSMDFWIPLMMAKTMRNSAEMLNERGWDTFELIGRLKPNVSIEQAQTAMQAVSQRLNEAYPNDRSRNTKVIIQPEIEGRYGDASDVIKLGSAMALVIVGLILLTACANVANLLLARVAERQKEIGVRIAIGASRIRLLRQLLTESVLLALLGGVLGLILAYWLSDLMRAFIPALPYNFVPNFFAIDQKVLIFSLVITLTTGLIFGLFPALYSTKPDVVPILKGEAGTTIGKSRQFSLKNLLVITQIALSLIVLVCGGLFIKSYRNAQNIDPGFESENRMLLSLNPMLLGYDDEKCRTFYTEITEKVKALPGVKSAAMVERLPLGDSSNSTGPVVKEGDSTPKPGEGISARTTTIGSGYFTTLNIPLLAGRDFDMRDKADSPKVAIINEELARLLWGNENPVGKRFRIGDETSDYSEVVGVAKNGKYQSLSENPRPFLFVPMTQRSGRAMTLVVSGTGNPHNLVNPIRQEVNTIDSRLPVFNIKTMEEHLTYAFMGVRMGASFALAFGLIALILAATGLYSLMSYAVSQRTREIGVRMALGAQRADVLKLITGQGMKLVIIGVVIGLIASFAVNRVLASLLIGIGTSDIATFFIISLLLLAVAFIACYLPARRATKVDPMNALRYE